MHIPSPLNESVRPAVPSDRDHGIRSVAIIGAGAMGRGIAAANVQAGIQVRISDQDPAAAAAAVDDIPAGDLPAVFGPSQQAVAATVITSDEDFADVDLVIEAVSENIDVKTALLSHIEPLVRPDALLASNSSSIPMGRLADCLTHPDRFCGLHFCYPVEQRPLVEIVGAETTSPRTLSAINDYARSIGMAPITVRDAPGFLLNRLLVPYLNEALELVLEQVDCEQLEKAARRFGFPTGPLAQLDDFGMDVALQVGTTLYRSFPDRISPSEMLIAMYKAGRLGRKTGCGFHFEDGVRSDTVVPAVQEIVRQRSRPAASMTNKQIERRLLLPMLLEATRALDESLVDSAALVDQTLQDGLGMTKHYRGLFGWADAVGARKILDWLEPLQSLGTRFEPTPMLLNMATHPDVSWTGRRSAA